VRDRVPPVRFGRKVEANGALVVNRETAVAVADEGKAARLYLMAWAGPIRSLNQYYCQEELRGIIS
jgi:hypothetical protein